MRKILTSLFLFLGSSVNGQFGWERNFDVAVNDGFSDMAMPWAGGLNFCQFSNIDLNFDGVKDLFVFDRTGDKVLTFLHTGGAGVADYVYAPEYESLFPKDLKSWVFLRDYNCDGLEDIFAYTIGGCRVYKNVGNSTTGHEFELEKPILKRTYDGIPGYIYSNSVDVPSIVDVDGDGDMDFFQFGPLGTAVEYHRNMSMENYGVCDSLEFEAKNDCWGRFRETGSPTSVSLNDTTVYPCTSLLSDPESPVYNTDRDGGKGLLLLDLNDNGVMDLLLGHQGGPWLIELYNEGTVPNTNSSIFEQYAYFPQETDSLHVYAQPVPYHVDINNDGVRDLVVSPAYKTLANNYESVWFFSNTNIDTAPILNLESKNFLQQDMIENGTGAFPVFFDANADGRIDLLVSCISRYTNPTTTEKATILLYTNIGTTTSPYFQLTSEDWMGISTMGIGVSKAFYPTFGDLDGDGDEDMIMGEFTGYCHYFENTAGVGSPAAFAAPVILTDNAATQIFDGQFTFPQLVDLDRDGDLDLVIGRRNGSLRHYENIGTTAAFSFELQTNELGGVDVSEWWSSEGMAIPQFIDVGSAFHLICGSKSGYLHYYTDIDGNLDGTFTLADSTLDNLNIGTRSAPAILNLDGGAELEMVLGTERGGMSYFKSADTSLIGMDDFHSNEKLVEIFPNPTSSILNVNFVDLSKAQLEMATIQLLDMRGNVLQIIEEVELKNSLDFSYLASGVYLINIADLNIQKRVIVE